MQNNVEVHEIDVSEPPARSSRGADHFPCRQNTASPAVFTAAQKVEVGHATE
jgi:hypothetical protein